MRGFRGAEDTKRVNTRTLLSQGRSDDSFCLTHANTLPTPCTVHTDGMP